ARRGHGARSHTPDQVRRQLRLEPGLDAGGRLQISLAAEEPRAMPERLDVLVQRGARSEGLLPVEARRGRRGELSRREPPRPGPPSPRRRCGGVGAGAPRGGRVCAVALGDRGRHPEELAPENGRERGENPEGYTHLQSRSASAREGNIWGRREPGGDGSSPPF